jgi:hypothetical protein
MQPPTLSGSAFTATIDDPQIIAVPSDLAVALEAAPEALHYFECLPYRRQRAFVQAVEDAVSVELRRRRIERIVGRISSSNPARGSLSDPATGFDAEIGEPAATEISPGRPRA